MSEETQPEPEPETESKMIEVGTMGVKLDLNEVNEKLRDCIDWDWTTWVEEMMPEATVESLSHILKEKETWDEVRIQWYKEHCEKQKKIKKKKTGPVIFY